MAEKDTFLPSGMPLTQNLLEPLKSDSSSAGAGPALPASIFQKLQSLNEDVLAKLKPMKVHVPGALPALPAITSRIRYHRPANPVSKFALVAALDMETAPFSQDEIEIKAIDMRLSGGTAMDLGQGIAPKLPLNCRPRDGIGFLYSLVPTGLSNKMAVNVSRSLDVTIDATVLASPECRPSVQMHWKTNVNFSSTQNSTHGALDQSLQSSNKSHEQSVTVSQLAGNGMWLSARDVQQRPGFAQSQHGGATISDLGVTISFTAPKNVYVRKPFVWDCLILNSSSRPRKLAISAYPKRSKGDVRGRSLHPPISSANYPASGNMAKAVVNETVLYALHRHARPGPAEIISMSATIEIG